MVEDIAQWFDRIGLGQYLRAFADNDIDLQALPYLSDEDLKELGVSLGHRRTLLAGITEFGAETPATPREALGRPRAGGRRIRGCKWPAG